MGPCSAFLFAYGGGDYGYRTKAAWAVRPIVFDKAFRDGRLVVVELFRGTGKRSFIICCVYGHAGSRWEAEKKRALTSMLKGIFEDAVSRGDVPTLAIGDYNTQVSECDYLNSLARGQLAHKSQGKRFED